MTSGQQHRDPLDTASAATPADILRAILEDGYLSESNAARAHLALSSGPFVNDSGEDKRIIAFFTKAGYWLGTDMAQIGRAVQAVKLALRDAGLQARMLPGQAALPLVPTAEMIAAGQQASDGRQGTPPTVWTAMATSARGVAAQEDASVHVTTRVGAEMIDVEVHLRNGAGSRLVYRKNHVLNGTTTGSATLIS